MKLKTRLFMAFFIVILVPVVRKVGTPEEPAAKRKKTYLDLDDFL